MLKRQTDIWNCSKCFLIGGVISLSKICTKCKQEKPVTAEYFHRNKNRKDGFEEICKSCKKEYYQENKEHIIKNTRKYREENKEHYQQNRKKYNQENKDKIAKQIKEYYEENREWFLEYRKQYYVENKEYILEQVKLYRVDNKERYKKYYQQASQRRRAVKMKLPNTLTIEEWNNIKLYFNNSCSYCGMTEKEHFKEYGEQLHQEHFVPLSRGGEYTHNNIIPSCRMCNASKSNKSFFEWYPKQKFYNNKKEEKILTFLNYEDNKTQQLSIF